MLWSFSCLVLYCRSSREDPLAGIKFISSLYNACFRDHFSSDLCKNVVNGVLFFPWLLLLV